MNQIVLEKPENFYDGEGSKVKRTAQTVSFEQVFGSLGIPVIVGGEYVNLSDTWFFC